MPKYLIGGLRNVLWAYRRIKGLCGDATSRKGILLP